MNISKISYSAAQLEGMGSQNLSTALLLGLFLNEVNWLQKLLLIATMDEGGNEAEHQARLSLSLMLSKLLATKMHAGWMAVSTGIVKQAIDALSVPQDVLERRTKMEPLFARNSIIHQVRNLHGGHYPAQLSLAGLPGIAQSDVALFMTSYSGDTISVISELSAATSMSGIAPAPRLHESIETILGEIIRAAGLYCEFIHGVLAELLVEKVAGHSTLETFPNDDAPALDVIRLRFFAAAPTSAAEDS